MQQVYTMFASPSLPIRGLVRALIATVFMLPEAVSTAKLILLILRTAYQISQYFSMIRAHQ